MDTRMVSVIDAVDKQRKQKETKGLDISFHELASMHEDGELTIRPAYQRLFRWSLTKQSQFIESLLMEMPLPPIFAIEEDEGKWELIDGLQRVSTWLHFRGELEVLTIDPPIHRGDALELTGCDIVPELNGLTYATLPTTLKIRLKRHFVRVELVRRETDQRFRYHMFKRLNSGGEILSEQEMRNCTVRLLGERFNRYIEERASSDAFETCIEALGEEARRRMANVELVLRFYAFKNNFDEFRHDIGPFLTNYMERVSDPDQADGIRFDYAGEEQQFDAVFGLLAKTLGGDTCRRWVARPDGTGRFVGGFSVHHFEAFALGVAKCVEKIDLQDGAQVRKIQDELKRCKEDEAFARLTTGGGQNSPGKYREKIDFVASRVRSAL